MMHATTQKSLLSNPSWSRGTYVGIYIYIFKWDPITHVFLTICFFQSLIFTSGAGRGRAAQEAEAGSRLHTGGAGPVLSPSCDAALLLGVGGRRNANLEGSKVKQRFRVSKHFPNTRFAVIRGSSFSQLHRDYFSILVCVLGLSSAGSLLSCLWSRAA